MPVQRCAADRGHNCRWWNAVSRKPRKSDCGWNAGGDDGRAPSSCDSHADAEHQVEKEQTHAHFDYVAEVSLGNRGREAIAAECEQNRRAGDYQKADAIRAELAARGIEIEDTPSGPRWKRKAESCYLAPKNTSCKAPCGLTES